MADGTPDRALRWAVQCECGVHVMDPLSRQDVRPEDFKAVCDTCGKEARVIGPVV